MKTRKGTGWTILVALVASLLFAGVVFFRKAEHQSETTREPSGEKGTVITHSISDTQWIVSKKDRDAYLGDLAKATREITLKPESGEAKESVSRLVILNITEGSPMYRAGFRKDDRVLKVNGTPIGTMSRALNLIHEIKACNRLTVEVQRGEQILDYQFDFE